MYHHHCPTAHARIWLEAGELRGCLSPNPTIQSIRWTPFCHWWPQAEWVARALPCLRVGYFPGVTHLPQNLNTPVVSRVSFQRSLVTGRASLARSSRGLANCLFPPVLLHTNRFGHPVPSPDYATRDTWHARRDALVVPVAGVSEAR